jgi:hypothetical protein
VCFPHHCPSNWSNIEICHNDSIKSSPLPPQDHCLQNWSQDHRSPVLQLLWFSWQLLAYQLHPNLVLLQPQLGTITRTITSKLSLIAAAYSIDHIITMIVKSQYTPLLFLLFLFVWGGDPSVSMPLSKQGIKNQLLSLFLLIYKYNLCTAAGLFM